MAKLNTNEKQFLAELIKPVNSRLRLALVMSTIATLLFVMQSWILATIFNHWFMQTVHGERLSADILWQWGIPLTVLFLLRPVFNYIRELIGSHASLKVRIALRERLLNGLAVLGMARQSFGSDGSLSSKVIEQTEALDGYISRFIVQKKVVVTTPLILLLVCAWQSWAVALILLASAPLVPILMIIIGKMTAKKSAAQFSALAQLSGRFLDWIRGMNTLKRLQATDLAEHDLYNASEDYRKRTMAVLKIAFLNGAVLELLSAFSIAVIAIYLGLGLLDGALWQQESDAFFAALFILIIVPEFYAPLRQLGVDYHAQAQAQGAVKALLPILQKAEELQNWQEHTHAQEQQKALDYTAPLALRFVNLGITYKLESENDNDNNEKSQTNNDKNVHNSESSYRVRLQPISFSVASGERVGLVGASGSGKSSLIQAFLGFSDYNGEIFISEAPDTNNTAEAVNEISHQQIPLVTLRQHIGYLAQSVALLPVSIAENLRLAKSTARDEELWSVLKAVELDELIKQLPQGLNTILGERGKGLSGGQQQRLGIAQLLLRESNVWLLDEPTEHLDPDTSERLHALLENVSRGKTVIWITHAVEQLPWLDAVVEIKK